MLADDGDAFSHDQIQLSLAKDVGYTVYLRSTMSQQRLNNLCLLSIEREVTDLVLRNLLSKVDKFALQKSRRLIV